MRQGIIDAAWILTFAGALWLALGKIPGDDLTRHGGPGIVRDMTMTLRFARGRAGAAEGCCLTYTHGDYTIYARDAHDTGATYHRTYEVRKGDELVGRRARLDAAKVLVADRIAAEK